MRKVLTVLLLCGLAVFPPFHGQALAYGGGALLILEKAHADEEAADKQLPNETLTPGAVMTTDAKVVCGRKTSTVRNVPASEKAAVYKEYGIASHKPGEYEVDHLISLELGGSNDIKNLWPQSYVSQPLNAHVKDRLENELHKRVCAGKMSLEQAQTGIAQNWIELYNEVFGQDYSGGSANHS